MYKFSLFLFAVSVFISSCQNNTESRNTGNTVKDEKGNVTFKKSSAAFLTTDYWCVEAKVKGGTIDLDTISTKGVYYKFYDNGDFDYGKYDEIVSTGRWHYNWSESLLDLKYERNPNNEPIQWTVKTFNDNMVFLGNAPQNNNGSQIKLTRCKIPPK